MCVGREVCVCVCVGGVCVWEGRCVCVCGWCGEVCVLPYYNYCIITLNVPTCLYCIGLSFDAVILVNTRPYSAFYISIVNGITNYKYVHTFSYF